MTVMFLGRDQWVTFLRAIGSMYNVSGSANWAGKLRTFLNFPLICCIYWYEQSPSSWAFIPTEFLYVFEGIAIVINAVSMFIYTRKYWPYLKQSTQSR
jgi:phosphatidylglycerophosphate synthase